MWQKQSPLLSKIYLNVMYPIKINYSLKCVVDVLINIFSQDTDSSLMETLFNLSYFQYKKTPENSLSDILTKKNSAPETLSICSRKHLKSAAVKFFLTPPLPYRE